jgi:hypothetical protein
MSDAKNNEGKHVISQQTYEYLAILKMPMGLYQHKYKHSAVFSELSVMFNSFSYREQAMYRINFLQFAPPAVIIEKTCYHLVSSI